MWPLYLLEQFPNSSGLNKTILCKKLILIILKLKLNSISNLDNIYATKYGSYILIRQSLKKLKNKVKLF